MGQRRPPATGLSSDEVLARRAQFGENRLPTEGGLPVWTLVLNQFRSPLVSIILVAAGISLVLGELSDFVIIMAVVVVNVILGFVQEYQAQRTYLALKGLLKPTTTVIRDGEHREVEVWELVPGDLVALAMGDKVPADGELAETTRLALDEAILTGESEPVTKHADGEALLDVVAPDAATEEARATFVYMGSTVVTGRARMRVTATGTRTELGQIAASLSRHTEEMTPLQMRLRGFSRLLTWIVLAATAVILGAGLLMGRAFLDMARTAIVLAIAAVPEGLIIAVTVVLVLGMRRILRRQGLVKRLLAVETLGSVTVICTDKTGTLTEGRMRVSRAELVDAEQALRTMVLCNNLEGPVDVALWEYAEEHLPSDPQALFDGAHRLGEDLFTSETKYMIAAVTSADLGGETVFFLKGAPEIVLGMCAPAAPAGLSATIEEWSGAGLRLLGLASRSGGTLTDHAGYTWVGLVGMEDPVRPAVPEAVRVAGRAGIAVKMITGDYARTAEAIARAVGIPAGGQTLEGREIAAMPDEELRERVRSASVFARIRPQDKLRIVRALQANREITAMIGDGVNDAPALMRAHIGVVVGSATDVAKESADLILLDSNFRTVVAAVEEGRVIFANIRKMLAYILSGTFAEMLVVFGAMLLGWPTPLLVTQILWINLICDGPSDMLLGFEPAEAGIMEEPPRPPEEPLLTRFAGVLIAVVDGGMSLYCLVLFGHFHALGDEVLGRSLVFASLAINSLVYIFAYRSLRTPLHRMIPVTANKPLIWGVLAGLVAALLPFWVPALGAALGVVPLSLLHWAWVVGFALFLLAVLEAAKAVNVRLARRQLRTAG